MASSTPILFLFSLASSAAVVGALWWKDVIRPGSLKKARDVSAIPTPIWLLCAAMVYLAQIEAVVLLMQWSSFVGPEGTVRREGLKTISYLAAGLGAGALVVYLLRPRAGTKAGLGASVRDVLPGALGMLLAAPVCVCAAIACQWLAGLEKNSVAHTTLEMIIRNRESAWTGVLILGAVIGAPVVEEIIYRGLLQSALLNWLGSPWGAIIGTSAIFAAMHTLGGAVPWYALPVLFVLSVAIGVAYEHTKKLGVPITMHVLFNLGNVVIGIATHPPR